MEDTTVLKAELLDAAKTLHRIANHNHNDGLWPIEQCSHPNCARRLALCASPADEVRQPDATDEVGAALAELRELFPATYCAISSRQGGHVRYDDGRIISISIADIFIQFQNHDIRLSGTTLAEAMRQIREYAAKQEKDEKETS